MQKHLIPTCCGSLSGDVESRDLLPYALPFMLAALTAPRCLDLQASRSVVQHPFVVKSVWQVLSDFTHQFRSENICTDTFANAALLLMPLVVVTGW